MESRVSRVHRIPHETARLRRSRGDMLETAAPSRVAAVLWATHLSFGYSIREEHARPRN